MQREKGICPLQSHMDARRGSGRHRSCQTARTEPLDGRSCCRDDDCSAGELPWYATLRNQDPPVGESLCVCVCVSETVCCHVKSPNIGCVNKTRRSLQPMPLRSESPPSFFSFSFIIGAVHCLHIILVLFRFCKYFKH